MTLQSLKETIERFLPCISKEPWESFVSQHPSVLPGDRLVGVASTDNCLIYTSKLDAGCSEETHRRQMADAQWNAFARTALPQLLRIAEELEARVKAAEDALEQADLSLRSIHATTDLEAARVRAYDGLKHSTAALAEIRK